jgi:hypothetical protein
LDLDKIVAELKSEQDRIGRAINALLEGTGLTGPARRSDRKDVAPKRRGGITPAGRRRLAAAMKARWAARRAKSAPTSNKPTTVAKAAAPKKRGGLTAAGRKRLSEMMKKRWAEKRKAASKG